MNDAPSAYITGDLMIFNNEGINWNYISQYKILNEDFIGKYKHKIDKYLI